MDGSLFEQLLWMNESETLDFKRDQYPWEGATDEEKGELLKDVLAFANAWRTTDAYILIGVKGVKSGRGNLHGITIHLDDHSIQEFVSKKTQRPVTFNYETLKLEGLSFGIIRIPVQERPLYLVREFGKLRRDIVYIRRGSSTDQAKPD